MCKKLIYLISFVVVLGLAGDVQAGAPKPVTAEWTGAGADNLWSTPENWSTGIVPTSIDTAIINLDPGPTIDPNVDAVAWAVVFGWSGSTGELTMNGGTLTIDWSHIGEDDGGYGIVNMNSGTIDTNGLTVGDWGSGTINMTGGTIRVRDDFIIAHVYESPTGTGHVNLDGGTITAGNLVMKEGEGGVATMDVRAGTLIIDGNALSLVQGYIDSNDPNLRITAYDSNGTLNLDYDVTNEDKTTLTATHFLNPIPADGSSVPVSLNQLQWTLPETGPEGGVVACVVYFGTDPVVENNPKVVGDPDPEAVESVSVGPLTFDTIYYWALDLYDSLSKPYRPYMYCPIFTFDTKNTPPIVNAGDDVDSWLVDELPIPPDANRVVQLNGIVTDDGYMEPYTVHWTVVSEPNSVTHPAELSDPNIVNPTITMTLSGLYELELAAYDGEFTSSDTIAIQLYDTSCEHAWNQPGFVQLAGDVNHDCKVDFLDFADFAASWLQENYSTE